MAISPKALEIQSFKDILNQIEQITELPQKEIDFKQFNFLVNNISELQISILVGLWLLQFFNDFRKLESLSEVIGTINRLKKDYPQSISIWDFLELLFNYLGEKNCIKSLFQINLSSFETVLSNDYLGMRLQQTITKDIRKRLAVNYTTFESADVLISTLNRYNFSAIIDPFCGSGRLISAYLLKLDSTSQFPHVTINDVMASAVLIAYSRIVLIFSKYNKDLNLIRALIGDAFKFFAQKGRRTRVEKFDLVIVNPPFTRTHRIEDNQKNHLDELEEQYKHYISGQIGLHIYSIFLADTILKEEGIFASILPASTILSKYSKGVHNLLLESYSIKCIATSVDHKSCSEGSSLREIFLVAKRANMSKESKVNFIRIINSENRNHCDILSKQMISKVELSKEWNWTIFLKEPKLLLLRKKFLDTELIKSGKELELDIVRGVEMYGPEFFFIPNKKWIIQIENKENLVIRSQNIIYPQVSLISIPKEYLTRILRKPGNYNHIISPRINDFTLSISDNRLLEEKWFIEYGIVSEHFAIPAKKKFGKKWFSHIKNQLMTKKPFGNLFLVDKFGISTTSIMAHYLEERLPCTKNFYLLRNIPKEHAKLLTAWLNSTFFIILFLLSRREIGGSYGRLQIMDYMEEALFIDVTKISAEVKDLILNEFDKIRKLELPNIPKQVHMRTKRNLDLAIAKSLNFSIVESENLLTDMYSLLNKIFDNLYQRDRG